MSDRLRVGIIGGGAMGSLFAGLLAGHDVTVLDARPDVVRTLRERGVQIDGEPPRAVGATSDPASLFASDVLFVFVKAHDTLAAIRPFATNLNPATAVVSLQNGLGNAEAIKTALGGAVALVLGVTSLGAVGREPGRVDRIGVGATVLGSGGATAATTQRVRDLLAAAAMRASTVYDIRPHIWGKLLANAAINPVAALLNRENAVVADDPDARELAQVLAREGAAVAHQLRIGLPFSDPWSYVLEIVGETADARNSMTIDLELGRRTEIDAVNGAIVSAGRRAGIATPSNEAVVRLVRARQSTFVASR
ncbi:MAG: ketopantoate reductase family protein [Vulcanimicrobiaceae bacterium]